MPSTAKEWKKSSGPQVEEISLPSGNTALVRRPGPEALLKSGKIPNSLLSVIQKLMDPKQSRGKSAEESQQDAAEAFSQEALADPTKLQDMFDLVDVVVVNSVVEPSVHPAPQDGAARDEEVLYVDEVDLEDKMFIFNFALGGTRSLERFREQSEAVVDALPAGPGLGLSTQPSS